MFDQFNRSTLPTRVNAMQATPKQRSGGGFIAESTFLGKGYTQKQIDAFTPAQHEKALKGKLIHVTSDVFKHNAKFIDENTDLKPIESTQKDVTLNVNIQPKSKNGEYVRCSNWFSVHLATVNNPEGEKQVFIYDYDSEIDGKLNASLKHLYGDAYTPATGNDYLNTGYLSALENPNRNQHLALVMQHPDWNKLQLERATIEHKKIDHSACDEKEVITVVGDALHMNGYC
jgi:hypothetical protein